MSDATTGATAQSGTAGRLADPAARRRLMAGVAEEPGAAKPDSILSVDNIVRQFGGITAVDVDHLEVQRGIITALIAQSLDRRKPSAEESINGDLLTYTGAEELVADFLPRLP